MKLSWQKNYAKSTLLSEKMTREFFFHHNLKLFPKNDLCGKEGPFNEQH